MGIVERAGVLRMKTKPDPTPKAKPQGEFWRGEGNRKHPPITLPRIRALEMPER
jgi:hypothetical protein